MKKVFKWIGIVLALWIVYAIIFNLFFNNKKTDEVKEAKVEEPKSVNKPTTPVEIIRFKGNGMKKYLTNKVIFFNILTSFS
jgi:hypothetical protein